MRAFPKSHRCFVCWLCRVCRISHHTGPHAPSACTAPIAGITRTGGTSGYRRTHTIGTGTTIAYVIIRPAGSSGQRHVEAAMGKAMEKESSSELLAIYEISKILNSSLDLPKTLREVLGVLSTHLKMRRSMVSLVPESGELHAAGAYGLTVDEGRGGPYPAGEGVSGRILTTGVPIVVPDIAKEPLFLNRTGSRDLTKGPVIAFLGGPLKAGREVLGGLS